MIYIALGANLPSRFGTPSETLAKACAVLSDRGLRILDQSRIWLTAPVPVSDQPWYHNSVISVETDLSPRDLLNLLLSVEHEFGRVRIMQNEARVLDLDIISYDDLIVSEDSLIIPHPRMHQRGFVLYPLRDITNNWVHPLLNHSIDDLVANLPSDQVAKPMNGDEAA